MNENSQRDVINETFLFLNRHCISVSYCVNWKLIFGDLCLYLKMCLLILMTFFGKILNMYAKGLE